ncbi:MULTISPECIES: RNA polymerase sigma factor [unclassified Sphingomonas]|jgi:RNA polymerase sigma factor (sigma-70 family)|uniref:RNA polymerase sigma factor n=1 Tax=unclassified Sphingomonas TaxID=196159 RepID=UPI0018E4E46F|nr:MULTISPECIES: RNA polymerase sigma factor [unclassified Sphingomonas]
MHDDAAIKRWFTQEVLPLERDLVRFIARHCRDESDVLDLRQEVYERALTASPADRMRSTRSYVFTIARNVLVDRARRAKIVSFEQIADIDTVNVNRDLLAEDRTMTARDELRRAMAGLDQLPPRCREVVRLRKVEGLSIRETADRMQVSHHTIERQLTLGLRALANFMLGGEARISRPPARSTSVRKADR